MPRRRRPATPSRRGGGGGGGGGTPGRPSRAALEEEAAREAEEDFAAWEARNPPRRPAGAGDAAGAAATPSAARRAVNAELECGVCLSVVERCSAVMECMHRFCADCIETSLRLGNNECPTCRKHMPSRRSVRPDADFDALVAAVYPGEGAAADAEAAFVANVLEARGQARAAGDALVRGLERQAQAAAAADGYAPRLARKRYRASPGSSPRHRPAASSDEDEAGPAVAAAAAAAAATAAGAAAASSAQQPRPQEPRPRRHKRARGASVPLPLPPPVRARAAKLARARKRRRECAPSGPYHGKGGGNGMSSARGMVDVQLRPRRHGGTTRDREEPLPLMLRQFVRMEAGATVAQVLEFVARELAALPPEGHTPPASGLELSALSSGPERHSRAAYAVLPRDMTVADARRCVWNRPQNLTLLYGRRSGLDDDDAGDGAARSAAEAAAAAAVAAAAAPVPAPPAHPRA